MLWSSSLRSAGFDMAEGVLDDRAMFCGIDIGASATKLLLLDAEAEILARSVRRSGVDYAATAEACLSEALESIGVERSRIARTVSTGYGRDNVPFAEMTRTELHCHGIGCYHVFRHEITIIDIGGQDNKIIRLDETGRRTDFKMNRKCAAGTGAFLEEIALRLDIAPEELDRLASSTDTAVRLNSFCTVFASTEMLSHLRHGAPLPDLIRGAFVSVIDRVAEMDRLSGDVVLTGGVVAHNPTTRSILAAKIGRDVLVPPYPQFTGALGAAIVALEMGPTGQEEHHA